MNTLSIFFPTENLRDNYAKKIFCAYGRDLDNSITNMSDLGVRNIHYKKILKQVPGYWISIKFHDEKSKKALLNKIKGIIPIFWFEKYLFFPKEVTSTRKMEEKWCQKYQFDKVTTNNDAWKTFLKEAQIHFRMGRADVARVALMYIYKNNPYFLKKYKRYYIFEDLAYYYEAKGELHKSIKCLKIQANLQPDSSEPYLNMSSFLLLNGLYEEAIGICEKGLRINPKDDYLSNNLLIAYFNSRNYEAALQHLKKLIRRKPNVSTHWKLMGDLFCEINKIMLAIICYQKAIAINSEDFREVKQETYYSLGVCYQHLNQYKEAIYYYKKLLKMNPTDLATLLNLSKIYGDDLNNYQKAEKYAKKVLELYPQDGYGHHNLGLIYLYTGKLEKAKWHLYKARKLIPYYQPVHDAIATLKNKKKIH